jgi:OmpA-OmpF porin, OOP family
LLRASGLGETRPVAPNPNPDSSDNPTGRQQNRRVEVVILTG